MKTIMLVAMIMLAMVPAAPAALELRLSTQLPERLPYLYQDRQLSVANTSPDAVLFPKNAFYTRMQLETEDGWLECRPLVTADPAPLSSIDWQEIDPGEVLSVSLPASRCLCQGPGSHSCLEWTAQPGTHRIKAVLTTYAHKIGVPEGAFDGVLESNVIEIRIKEPTGVDAEAIAWANGSPMKVELLKAFPTSEYAAFYLYGDCRLDGVDPTKIRSMVEQGLYPRAQSVPDRDGWRSLDREGVARWHVEWGQLVLREHPDFPYRDWVRVSVALSRMSLGQRKEALGALEEIAESGGSKAAAWSKAFLDAAPEK